MNKWKEQEIKSIEGGRANSTINNSKICLGQKNIHNQQSNNISIIKKMEVIKKSILKNKLI